MTPIRCRIIYHFSTSHRAGEATQFPASFPSTLLRSFSSAILTPVETLATMPQTRKLVPKKSSFKLTQNAHQKSVTHLSQPQNAQNQSRYLPPIMDDDENQFIVDDVTKIVKETIETLLTGTVYQQEKVNQWSASVSEQCLSALSKLKKNFKYVVTCSIMQKTGAGLHTASSCYWDSATDGTCTVRWENKTMYCVVTVFGLAI